MDRRTFVATGGLLVTGLAGCSGGDGSDPATDDGNDPTTDGGAPTPGTTTQQTEQTTETTATYGDLDVSVEAVQPGVVELISPDSVGVHDASGQFVYVQVESGERSPPREAFALRFDGRSHAPEKLDDYRLYRERNGEGVYSRASGTGWILFALPETGDASDAAVTWPGGEWALPERARERLASAPPELSVSVEVSDPLPVDEQPTLTVTVTNEGSTPGRFVAGVNRQGPMVAYIPVARLSVPVPVGESVSETITDSFFDTPPAERLDDGEPDATYTVRWGSGSQDAEIRLTESAQ